MQQSPVEKDAPRRSARPNKRNLIAALLLMAGGLGTMVWMALNSGPEYAPPPTPEMMQPGAQAVDFTLDTLDGTPVSLSDFHGQVVLVNLWATWCPPCRAEMPDLDAFYDAHRDKGLVVLAVNQREPASLAADFVNEFGFSFSVLLDLDGAVGETYLARTLPMTYVIDQNGRIRHVQRGLITHRELERFVTPLLDG